MHNNTFESLVGAVVVAAVAAFFFFAYSTSGHASVSGYDVKAEFSSVDGVAPGTDVRVNGIKIGTVASMDLDPKTYQAILHMTIRNDVKLPDDSSIKVTSAGLLGSPYLAVSPGGSDSMLVAGGSITNTQGSIDLMGLLGQFIYGKAGSK